MRFLIASGCESNGGTWLVITGHQKWLGTRSNGGYGDGVGPCFVRVVCACSPSDGLLGGAGVRRGPGGAPGGSSALPGARMPHPRLRQEGRHRGPEREVDWTKVILGSRPFPNRPPPPPGPSALPHPSRLHPPKALGLAPYSPAHLRQAPPPPSRRSAAPRRELAGPPPPPAF